jgi:hypothetical protein
MIYVNQTEKSGVLCTWCRSVSGAVVTSGMIAVHGGWWVPRDLRRVTRMQAVGITGAGRVFTVPGALALSNVHRAREAVGAMMATSAGA